MKYIHFFWYYLIIINVISGLVFAYDKTASIKDKQRIPERTLHLLEFLGGVFANLILIYILGHKSKKPRYYMWTWIYLIVWIFVVLLLV